MEEKQERKSLRKLLKKKFLKTYVPLWVLLVIVFSGVALSITILTLTPEKISIFTGQVQASDFVVDSVISTPKGKNTVVVAVKLRNTDTATHSANVTVQLIDSNGDIIEIDGELMEQTKQTGDVAGGASVILVFTFKATDLVAVYETYQINIYQTS